jgi:DNA-binding response OmpR family regulator
MKILIVEDEKELAQDIVKYLSGQNYVCEVAENYNQATDKIAVYQYDCILLDLMLPDGNGLALLEQLKRVNKQDGVILFPQKILLRTK